MQLSFSLALIAGLVSFLSPCVLPLVPAYIGYMGGRVTNTVVAQAGGAAMTMRPTIGSRFSTMLHGFAFVAGFAFVFVSIGLLGTAFVNQIGRQNINVITGIIGRAGGLLIIFFGLHFMGILPSLFNRILARRQILNTPLISFAAILIVGAALYWILADWLLALPIFVLFVLWLVLGGAFGQPEGFWSGAIVTIQRALYTDSRRQMVAQGHQSYAGSAIMGVIFAAGWTPCIGPIYGSILTMAAQGGDVATAGWLLLAYSLGLGIPFIVTAFLLEGAERILRHMRRYLHAIELVSGAFLIAIGVLVASGRLQYLSQSFSSQISDLSYNFEECSIDLSQGQIALGDFINCINTYGSSTAAGTTAASTTTAAVPATAEPIAAAATVSAPQTKLADAPSIMSLAASAPETHAVGLEIGDLAPSFTTTTDTGAAIHLADQRGKVVLVNFWATWCGPCRVEMPEFQKAFAAKNAQGFSIIGVNNAETVDQVKDFRSQFGLSFPLALDTDAQIQQLYGIRSYPSTYVLNRDGVITAQHFGPLTVPQIDDLIDQALS